MRRTRPPDSELCRHGPYGVFIHHCDDTPKCRPWRMPQRRLEHWLLVTSLDGSERIVVDDNTYSVANGASYIIQPGALHDLSSARGSTPCWVHFDLLFDPRRSEPRTIGGPYDSELGVRSVHLQPDAQRLWGIDLPVLVPPPLDALFRSEVPALIADHRNGLPGRMLAEARLAGLLARFVALAWGSQPGTRPNDDLDRLARAEAVARQRLDKDFTLHSFVAVAGLGRSQFCQLYSKLRGESPGAFLRRERQTRAESLLRTTDLPLAQIATLVGFRDATVFVRAFRRHRGTTPGAWREAQQ